MKNSSTRSRIALTVAVASLLFARASFGQAGPDSLALSSGTAASNGSVALNLALASPAGSEPSAIEWTLTYPPANVVSISVNSGPALTAAGKALNCYGGSGTFACVASAMNAGIISNGVAAVVNLTMAAGPTTTAIGIVNSAASSPAGKGILFLAAGGTVTGGASLPAGAPVLPTVASLSCLPAILNGSGTSTCTVALTGSAPAGGAILALTNTNPTLTVPTSVTVAAAATSATFSASAAAIGSSQSATVTAAYNNSSASVTIGLLPPGQISSLNCSPASLGSGASSNCTVSLTQKLPSISLVHVTSCGPQTFPTSTCTIPATGSGNLIVVGWQGGGGISTSVTVGSITDNAGNAYVEAGAARSFDSVSGSVADIWYAKNSISGATTLTITPSVTVTGGGAVIWEFSGADLSAPLDQTAILNSQAATATPSGAMVTTTSAGDVVISLAPVAGNVTGIASGNAFVSDSALKGNGWAHVMATSAGPYSAQWNQSPADAYSSSTVAFRAAASLTLTSNNPLLTVPASVTVPTGTTTATFIATAGAIASNQSATITATYNNSSAQAAISLVAPVLVSSLACSSISLGPVSSSTCTVTLTQPAPTGGAVVTLSNTNSALTVPASVTVAAGATSATFIAITVAFGSIQSATITGAYNNSSASVTIGLVASVQISSLACNPTSLGQNTVSACTVILTQTAPTGGSNVTLASNNSSLTVPASVTVAAGATIATFSATAAAIIAGNQSATVTATLGGSSQTAAIGLLAPGQISSLNCSPASLGSGASSNCTVSLAQGLPAMTLVHVTSCGPQTFPTSTCTIPATGSGNLIVVGWQGGGGISTSVTVGSITDNAGNAYVEAGAARSFDSVSGSVADIWYAKNSISGATTLTITPSVTVTGAAAVIWEFSGADLSAPLDQTAILNSQAATATPTGAVVTTTSAGDVVISLAPVAGNVTGIASGNAFVSDSALKGNGWAHVMATSAGQYSAQWNESPAAAYSSSTVAFRAAASVTLTSNNPLLTVPASVTVPTGTTTATFIVTAGAIASNQSATVTATLGSSSQTAAISLVASTLVSGVACSPASLGANSSSSCTVTLTRPAPTAVTVVLTNTNPALTVPASVTVAQAATSATFIATTTTVSSNQSATITAAYNSSSANATITLVAPVLVSLLVCNPTILGPNSSASCTVTLTQPAPTGGATVTLTNTNATLTVPASVTVAAAATSAAFGATTAAIGGNRIATITATYNSSSANAAITLAATVLVSSLVCNSTVLGPNSSTSCTVTLTQPAPTGGATVTLTNTNATLTVPASVTVAAAATSAAFGATTAAIGGNQSATVTATYNSSSANASITLAASVLVSSLVCNSTVLGPNSSTSCTVTLTQPAPTGGATVTLTNTNATLTVPASVIVAAAATSAAFGATTAAIGGNQSATVTATYNSSSANASITLAASVLVSSLVCNRASLGPNASGTCTVTLNQPAPTGGATVTLTNTNATLTVPASVTVAAAATSAAFGATTAAIGSNQSATVTATLGTSSLNVNFTLLPTPVLSSLTCVPTSMPAGSGSACTVTMSNLAGNIVVNLSSNNAALTVPATLTVPQGSSSAGFSAATLSSASGWIVVTATFNGTSKALVFQITAASNSSAQTQVNRISCTPKSLTAGSRGTCRITLDHVENSTAAEVQLSSSSASLRLPERVATRPGQSTLQFQVDAVSSGEGIEVAAHLGSGIVRETLTVAPDRSTPIHVPSRQFVRYGTEVRFRVSPSGPAATLSAGALPAGAHFESKTGEFRWTPDGTQLGAHEIDFTAIDSAGVKASASVTVQVDSGEPVVTGIVNAASRSPKGACSPGAIASIEGRWLTDGAAVADASGGSMELAGTKVWANGATVPILSASGTELSILCPDSVTESDIQLVVETGHGVAAPFGTTARLAAPGIFSLDGTGTGQGWVLRESTGTNSVAMVRNYRVPGQPAIPGERLLIYATGVGHLTNISVQIGENKVPAAAIKPVPNHPGLYQVVVSMPNIVTQKDDLALSLSADMTEGRIGTNIVNIAVEADSR